MENELKIRRPRSKTGSFVHNDLFGNNNNNNNNNNNDDDDDVEHQVRTFFSQ
jgi:hypothetical protein